MNLVILGRFQARVTLLLLLAMMPAGMARAQEAAPPAAPAQTNTFFAGSVTQITAEKIAVSRKVYGKTENRTFRITPATKVEGKLKMKVRVTVRYSSDENGDTATLIVVRTSQQKK